MTQTIDSDRLGNTCKAKRSPRSRCWCLTVFNKEYRDTEMPKTIYQIRCDDSCKDGSWHAHMVFYFKSQISFNSVKKIFPDAHIEAAKNVCDSIGYIKNNMNGRKSIYFESGNEPKDTRFMCVKDLKECATPDELDWKQYNTWRKIHDNDEIDIDDFHKDVKVYYIQGPSGVGKTQKAIRLIRENGYKKFSNAKYENGFWCNVGSNRDVLLYDDFRDSHMKASEFINLIDYNKHSMNLKGSSCSNDYKLIIITSVQYITEIYKSCYGEPRKQWMRRVEVINLKASVEDNDEIDIDAL